MTCGCKQKLLCWLMLLQMFKAEAKMVTSANSDTEMGSMERNVIEY